MKPQVLVVDDDQSVLYTVKRILENAKLIVETADSGKSCVRKIQEGFTGLVLMDVLMPEIDGWDTIRILVEEKLIDRVIICMLTGTDEPGEKMAELKEYVLDYVTKPFLPAKLVEVVKTYLSYLDSPDPSVMNRH